MAKGTRYKYEDYHRINDNGNLEKKCVLHSIWFPNENPWFICTNKFFHKNSKNSKDGLHPECKKCASKKARKRNLEHPEEWKASLQKIEQKPERKMNNRKRSEKQRKAGKQAIWQQNNPDKVKANCKRKRNRIHNINNSQWQACKEYFNNSCAYCGLHIDKHYNIYAGKLRKEDLQKEHVDHFGSNGLENCIPACKSCNCSKWEFIFKEWYNKDNPNFTEIRYNKIIQWLKFDYKKYL